MLMAKLQAFWDYLKLLAKNYQEDGCQMTAAALTYLTLFAVVPLLTVTYTVLASFEAFTGMDERLQAFLFNNVVPENVAIVEGYLSEFSSQARSLSLPSLVVLAVTAFMMMFTIERAFNGIWRVQEPRQGFQRILMYWAVLTLGPPMVGGGIAITTYLGSLPLISDVANSPDFLKVLPLILNTAVITLMYLTIPNCMVPIRHGLVGGAIVAVLFEVVKQMFGTVMGQTDFEVIYGTYAAVPLFLIWVYLSWAIVLFGAELTKGLGLYRSERSEHLEPPLIQILIILEVFFRAHKNGDLITEREITKLGDRVDLQSWHSYKSILLSMGIIRPVEKGGLVLSRDLNEITFWELYRSLSWPLPERINADNEGWEARISKALAELDSAGNESLQIDLEKLFREGELQGQGA